MSFAIFNTLFLILVGVTGYILGFLVYQRLPVWIRVGICLVSFLITVLWLFYNLSVFHLLKMQTLIRVLSLTRIEYTAFFVGVFSAVIQLWINRRYKLKGAFSRHNGVVFTVFLMIPVYIYPIIYPVETEYHDMWRNGVCIQSSEETCGPSCVATLLRQFDIRVTEKEVADRVFLSKMGTDIWHLARYFKRQGLEVEIVRISERPVDPPVPSIAMVHQEGMGLYNHCIVILDKTENTFVIGDPGFGRVQWPKETVFRIYRFLGYVVHVREKDKE